MWRSPAWPLSRSGLRIRLAASWRTKKWRSLRDDVHQHARRRRAVGPRASMRKSRSSSLEGEPARGPAPEALRPFLPGPRSESSLSTAMIVGAAQLRECRRGAGIPRPTPSSMRCSSSFTPVNVRPKSQPFSRGRTHFTWPGPAERVGGPAEPDLDHDARVDGGRRFSVETRAPAR